MKETDVQAAVLNALKLHPLVWRAWRNRSTETGRLNRRMDKTRVGSPDVEGIMYDGRYIGIEVKLPEGTHKTTPEQLQWGEDVRRLGCCWFVARYAADVFSALARYTEGGEAWLNVDAALIQDSTKNRHDAAAAPRAAVAQGTSRENKQLLPRTKSAKAKRPNRKGGGPTSKGSGRK